MGSKHGIRMLLAAVIGTALFSPAARACSCAPTPPPCEAVGRAQLVFIGTVIEIKIGRPFKLARMKVDRTFKGTLPAEIELYDDGMCNGPVLTIGGQYLMYTQRDPSGSIPARGCNRSRAIQYADEDLQFLKDYKAGKPSTRISGTVRLRPDEPEDSRGGRRPMKDVRVILTHGGKEYSRTTDANGNYSISGIPPGQYEIHAELAGHRTNWSPDTITVSPMGCAVADVLMKVDRRVQGIVRNARGEPVPDIMVELVPTHPNLKRWLNPILLGRSDDEGRFAVDGAPPGDYYLGININHTPTPSQPYPPTYYPNTQDIKQAIPIAFMTSGSVQSYDLTVPAKLPLIKIHGRIVDSAGSPSHDRTEVRIEEPGLYGQIERQPIKIDSDGRFEFELCEGVRYSAFAFSMTGKVTTYSAPIEFVPTQEHTGLIFVLDKSSQDFRALSRKLEEPK